MPDYGSSSLWTDEPCHVCVAAELLPLAHDTGADLSAWSHELFEFLHHDGDDEWQAEHAPLHHAEGLRLWKQVRDELGADYEVGFAVFEPDPDRPDCFVKRVVWDPADL